jgi:hypothetical protein
MGNGGSVFSWANVCVQQQRFEPRPETTNAELTIANSQQCNGCALNLSQTTTSSVITVTRNRAYLVLKPSVPFTVTFNGTSAVFDTILVYVPSPLSVEQTQSDAVLHCMSTNQSIWLLIPLMKTNMGDSVDFLSAIAGGLDPATPRGLGIVNPTTGAYASQTVSTGQEWSVTKLVKGTDPYFTWVNGNYELFVKSESKCERVYGWRSTAGPQVIFFQNPVGVSGEDIDRIRETIGTVNPRDIELSVSNVLYSPGEAKCPPKFPSLKMPKFKVNPSLNESIVWFGIILTAFLAVVCAVALVVQKDGPIQRLAHGLIRMFTWKKSSSVPAPAPALPALPTALPTALPAGLTNAAKLFGK